MHAQAFDPITGEGDFETVPVTPVVEYDSGSQYALQLIGNSLNRVAPPGSYVICVKLEGYPGGDRIKALDGKLVHVERKRDDLVETTVKRLVAKGRYIELHPDSNDPHHQAPLILADPVADVSVRILGVVVGLFQRV